MPALRRYARALTRNADLADDLVQETITKLYVRWSRISGVENLDAYVHTMLVRIFLDEKRIQGKDDLERLVAHEIAHQWFGDSVSQRDWYDLWLSEGFATYFAALFAERAGGVPALRAAMSDARALYLGATGAAARPIHDPSITDLTKLLNRLNYQKGAWVLHMLRGIIGDDAFFAGVREYYATYRNGNASTGELRAIMERHHGEPLEWFFRQWIYEPGHPVFTTNWTWREGRLQLDVAQTQQGPVFRIPATVEVRDAANQPLALAQLHALFPEDAPAPAGSVEKALESLREACAEAVRWPGAARAAGAAPLSRLPRPPRVRAERGT